MPHVGQFPLFSALQHKGDCILGVAVGKAVDPGHILPVSSGARHDIAATGLDELERFSGERIPPQWTGVGSCHCGKVDRGWNFSGSGVILFKREGEQRCAKPGRTDCVAHDGAADGLEQLGSVGLIFPLVSELFLMKPLVPGCFLAVFCCL